MNSLKEEIIELKKQLDYWYVEKVGYEKKESDLKAEISDLKKQLDALKKEGRNGWFWWSWKKNSIEDTFSNNNLMWNKLNHLMVFFVHQKINLTIIIIIINKKEIFYNGFKILRTPQ